MKAKKEMFENNSSEDKGVRINKYLADAGVCSRREGDAAIEAGLVSIDGVPALMGSRVHPGQRVTYKGRDISKIEDLILIAFNKPVGIVCTTDRRDPDNIIDFISYEKRIFPIGRLDKDSEGLILLTNDGNIVNKILRAGNYHEKEYIVRVNKEITPEFIQKMSAGVYIPALEQTTRPCTVEQVDKFTFRIILTQGLNRQIRRMCETLDYRVRALQRVRIMNITLGRLKSGTYRNITELELNKLKELISDSSNTPTSGDFRDSEGELEDSDIEDSKHVLLRQAMDNKRKYDNRGNKDSRTSAGFAKVGSSTRTDKDNNNGTRNKSSRFSSRISQSGSFSGRGQKSPNNRTDRSSFSSSKSLRAGRPGNHQ